MHAEHETGPFGGGGEPVDRDRRGDTGEHGVRPAGLVQRSQHRLLEGYAFRGAFEHEGRWGKRFPLVYPFDRACGLVAFPTAKQPRQPDALTEAARTSGPGVGVRLVHDHPIARFGKALRYSAPHGAATDNGDRVPLLHAFS
jgi:hypothetical protein